MPRLHSVELVPYDDGRVLSRCHGCGARAVHPNLREAELWQAVHKKSPMEHVAPSLKAVVIKRKDTGGGWPMDMQFDNFMQAARWVDGQIHDPHNAGYIFVIAVGHATPEHLTNMLSPPSKEDADILDGEVVAEGGDELPPPRKVLP